MKLKAYSSKIKEITLFLHRDIILYVENPKKSTKKLLEQISVYQGHRIKAQYTKIYYITLHQQGILQMEV